MRRKTSQNELSVGAKRVHGIHPHRPLRRDDACGERSNHQRRHDDHERDWIPRPNVKEQLFRSGLDASPSTPKEFGAYIRSELAKWSKVVKASGAKAE